MWTSRVLVEPYQLRSQTSSMSVSRVTARPASEESRAVRQATTAAEALDQRAGVCQDFSHLMIGGLRAMGLPARYVSGYVRTWPPPGQPRRVGGDQSHAWVGCWLGPDHGWIDLDPTNNLVVADEHVVLGWGRDYSDVSPLSGVLLGGGAHTLAVSVDMEPVEDANPGHAMAMAHPRR